ncbi:unnamed protein product [Merluccius merluccius]
MTGLSHRLIPPSRSSNQARRVDVPRRRCQGLASEPRCQGQPALSAEQMPLAVPGEQMSLCQETGVQRSNGQVLAWTSSAESETTGE